MQAHAKGSPPSRSFAVYVGFLNGRRPFTIQTQLRNGRRAEISDASERSHDSKNRSDTVKFDIIHASLSWTNRHTICPQTTYGNRLALSTVNSFTVHNHVS